MGNIVKTNRLNTTTLTLAKATAKKSRPTGTRIWKAPETFEEMRKQYPDLLKTIRDMQSRIDMHENRLNGFAVDPTTKAVTYPST
jgi:predicted  nucleic acid-binding Zn-ribbon protein